MNFGRVLGAQFVVQNSWVMHHDLNGVAWKSWMVCIGNGAEWVEFTRVLVVGCWSLAENYFSLMAGGFPQKRSRPSSRRRIGFAEDGGVRMRGSGLGLWARSLGLRSMIPHVSFVLPLRTYLFVAETRGPLHLDTSFPGPSELSRVWPALVFLRPVFPRRRIQTMMGGSH
jgi:hypothetical protein